MSNIRYSEELAFLRGHGLGIVVPTQLTGLSWNGNPGGRRAIRFSSVVSNGLSFYPATYIWKIYQRNQVTGIGDSSRYYTTFFWGNDGTFDWDTGYPSSYYGFHPYPTPANQGDGKWEVSFGASDDVTRDDGSAPYVTNDRWYDQAAVVSDQGGGNFRMKFYVDLPGVSAADTITVNSSGHNVPPAPCLIWGQAPAHSVFTGVSWGGYSRWEETNAIIRGVQVYNAALTEAQVLALRGYEHDADVLAYCAANSITSLWYLNMNWKLADINDKSGAGHHPALVQTNGAAPVDWSG